MDAERALGSTTGDYQRALYLPTNPRRVNLLSLYFNHDPGAPRVANEKGGLTCWAEDWM